MHNYTFKIILYEYLSICMCMHLCIDMRIQCVYMCVQSVHMCVCLCTWSICWTYVCARACACVCVHMSGQACRGQRTSSVFHCVWERVSSSSLHGLPRMLGYENVLLTLALRGFWGFEPLHSKRSSILPSCLVFHVTLWRTNFLVVNPSGIF